MEESTGPGLSAFRVGALPPELSTIYRSLSSHSNFRDVNEEWALFKLIKLIHELMAGLQLKNLF